MKIDRMTIRTALPSDYTLSPNDVQRIMENNKARGFLWNEEAQIFIAPTDHISETENFITVNGKRVMKKSAIFARRKKS